MPLHLLHIQDLTAERQDSLRVAVAALLGRTTCGVTLHKEYLAFFRILIGTVGQLSGQSATRHRVLTLYAFTGLAGGNTGRGCQNHLVADESGFLGMFFQIIGKSLTYSLLHGTGHLGVTEFGLGLAFKLRLSHLDRDNGRKTFAEVFTGNLNLGLLDIL